MAYAAVIYLSRILEQMSNPHLQQHQTPLQDQQIKSLQEKLNFTLDFLDDSLHRRSEEIKILEREIRDAACEAADIFESYISKNFGQEGLQERQIRDQTFCEKFEIVAAEIDSIKRKAAELKVLWGATDLHQSQSTSLPTGPSRLASSGRNDMVGFREDVNQIIDRLIGYPPSLKVIPIIGMGGIGKTTLAKNIYNDPHIEEHFYTRAWVSISQEYREREVLLSLLDSMKLSDEMRQQNRTENLKECRTENLKECRTEKLKERLYKSLKDQRYLVVMDDVWTTEAWNSLRRMFPDDKKGSRIMLTTRVSSVIDSPRSPHCMQLLNETDSWNLLCQKVFGEDSCPCELEEAGKEIAENCEGLPLSLVVIGGHLSKANRTKDHWEYVAQNVKSVVNSTDANFSDILSLSYDYLPHYLKACFLYMGVFPEDDEIRVSRLIKLWVAEGFLKPVRGKTLEEVAEECLGDLISRNLIMISKKSSRGKIKTCRIHDMLRDLCLKKAQEEEFFHVRNKENISAESMKYPRRLCTHPDILHEEFKCYQSMGSLPTVRSILIPCFLKLSYSEGRIILPTGLDESQINELVDGTLCPLLRVLDLKQYVQDFSFGEIKLVHSRYLAFSFQATVSIPKIFPDFLGNLQTLIVASGFVHLPEEIWRMTQLRHLLFFSCYLPCPTRSPIAGENFVLGNLLTLSIVSSSSCTKEVFERVPNLNKLRISNNSYKMISLGTLVNLPQLETLKITSYEARVRVPINFTFPPNIKKLTLCGCKIAWKRMTIVGSMPNLEVLKLLDDNIWPPKWELTEGEFSKLKFLLLKCSCLVQWRASDTNFKSLECLIIRECFDLKEIPGSIGDIPTLQLIELDNCSSSAENSAKQIQEEQKNLGNDILQVRVLYRRQSNRQQTRLTDEGKNTKFRRAPDEPQLKSEELDAELMAKLESNDDELQTRACFQLQRDINRINALSKGLISRIFSRLLEFLDRDDYPQLQLAAANAIVDILCYSDDDISINTNILIEQGAAPIMALVVLGEIAGRSADSRDLILRYGVLTLILAQFNDKTNLIIIREATQTLSELCSGPLQLEQVKSAILPLSQLIQEHDETVVRFAWNALFNLTCGKKDIKQAVVDAGVFPHLVERFKRHKSYRDQQTIYNIISYVDDTQIQVIIDDGVLCYLRDKLILNNNISVMESTCYIISNIIGRTKDHIQAVIEAGIISPLLLLLQDADLFNAAAKVIYNATTKGTNEQINFLVHEGCIEPMCDLLVNPYEAHVIKICLKGLENILKVGEAEKNQGNTEDVNFFAQMIEDAGGLQKIKSLKTCDYSKIRRIAGKILVTYWHQEDDNVEDSDDDDGSEMMSTEDEEDHDDDNEFFIFWMN
ncbi:putative late blight resistance protein homolog R1A-3 isoform X2 [Olea europaea var. sylvestris]|uniref:putative late blight resistance protein homolog R1A-3 isoform X2 n=1 Tax=Olea europaea var. sylvestris TaxID=158386 RepID=UPI000C1D3C00|nr:putative late blight resistance protein homolog R1A-3 isoform X2 [Olea europaea var. sylvestris]